MDRTEFLLECERALVEIRDLVLDPDDKVSSDWLAEAVAFPSGIVGAARERINNEQADREFCRRTLEIIDQLERETRPLLGLAAEDENDWTIVWDALIERCKRLQTALDNTHALIEADPALSERLDNAQLSAAMWEATEVSKRLEAKVEAADKLAVDVVSLSDTFKRPIPPHSDNPSQEYERGLAAGLNIAARQIDRVHGWYKEADSGTTT